MAFTARLRALLARQAPGEFTWIMNRDAYYTLRQEETLIDLGPSPDAVSPDYALVARFDSLRHEDARRPRAEDGHEPSRPSAGDAEWRGIR
jgi:hypothetical protein